MEQMELKLTDEQMRAVFRENSTYIPKPLLSICVISTKEDSEKYGKMFLANLPKSPDIELIFVTTINSDNASIVTKRDVRLVTAEYHYSTNLLNFASARNYAKSLATGTWIMSIDTDEVLGKHSHSNLIKILKQYENDTTVLAFRVGIVSSGWDHTLDSYVRVISQPIRIFRNIYDICWTGRLHEVVLIDADAVLDTPLIFEHYGYSIELDESLVKFERNIRGIAWELTDNNDRFDHFLEYMSKTIAAYKKMKDIKNKIGK